MQNSDFIENARGAGEFDSEGRFTTDLDSMREKLSAHLHGSPGIWLVALLQALTSCKVGAVSMSRYSRNLELRFPSGGLPPLSRLHASLTSKTPDSEASHDKPLLRALTSLSPGFDLSWSFLGERLNRWDNEWTLDEVPTRELNRIDIRAPKRTDWDDILGTLSQLYPLPPIALTLDGEKCWKHQECGRKSKLLFRRKANTESFCLMRLGLSKEPTHAIHFLSDGVIVHSEPLAFCSDLVCIDIFQAEPSLETDLTGLATRLNDRNKEVIKKHQSLILHELRDMLSDLISRPRLPLRYEEQQRYESAVGSAVALGGLAFLQLPFFPPLLTLGLGTAVATGMLVRAGLVRKRQPWRGEQGFHNIRRDLVEIRKPIDAYQG